MTRYESLSWWQISTYPYDVLIGVDNTDPWVLSNNCSIISVDRKFDIVGHVIRTSYKSTTSMRQHTMIQKLLSY